MLAFIQLCHNVCAIGCYLLKVQTVNYLLVLIYNLHFTFMSSNLNTLCY